MILNIRNGVQFFECQELCLYFLQDHWQVGMDEENCEGEKRKDRDRVPEGIHGIQGEVVIDRKEG